jgi:pimeloyl-ACP methyl ester carboxylesterase
MTVAAVLVLVAAALALLIAVPQVSSAYRAGMARAYERIASGSQVLRTSLGDVEYTLAGRGTPVLVIHGSGGGFDQGELLGRLVLDEDVRRITPSRFGYLRSTHRAGAGFEEQAHAYVALLDHLGVERVAVLAFSHGGPSALLLAALHPERVSSLTLLSAGVASFEDADQRRAHLQGKALMWIYQDDFRYWVLTHALRGGFLALMGVSAEVVAALEPEQRQWVDDLLEVMQPARPRAAGAAFDHHAAMPNARIAAIRTPTLVIHARDDSLQLYRNAEYAADRIVGARLVGFERGGHLLAAVERNAIRRLVMAHLRANASP